MHRTFKGTALLLAGILAFSGTVGMDTADDTSSAAETATETDTSETTEPASESTEPSTENNEAAETDDEWQKADITDYDASLSLISYEQTTPEMLQVIEKEEPKKELTEEEIEALKKRRSDIRKASPRLGKRHTEPTAVELHISGGALEAVPDDYSPQVEYNSGEFAIVSYGWGHGVGMSQNGANLYAINSDWTYQDILFHYYPGTYLMDTGMTEDEKLTIAHEPAGDTLEVVSKIVFNEVGGSFAYEAIKAQAVAVYTYIKYNGDDSADLRGKENPPQIVIDACKEVLGQALYYDGNYALTMFSASCGGCSANCYEVFSQDIPYLRSVDSYYDGAYDPHYATVTYYTAEQMKDKLEKAYNITLSDDPNNWIQPVYSDETGYVTDVCIDGQLNVRGYPFSLKMGFKSSKFNIEYTY